MVIWIDGPYGVGKSTVSIELAKQLHISADMVLDSDEYLDELMKEDIMKYFYVEYPQNCVPFLHQLADRVTPYISDPENILIVNMALSTDECINILWNKIKDIDGNLIHVVLTGEMPRILERIQNDSNRESGGQKDFALTDMRRALCFIGNHFDPNSGTATWISTTYKTPAEIATEIIKKCHLMPRKKCYEWLQGLLINAQKITRRLFI